MVFINREPPEVPFPGTVGEFLPQTAVAEAFAVQWQNLVAPHIDLSGALINVVEAVEALGCLQVANELLVQAWAREMAAAEQAEHTAALRACRVVVGRTRATLLSSAYSGASRFQEAFRVSHYQLGLIEGASFAALHGEDATVSAVWSSVWNAMERRGTQQAHRADPRPQTRRRTRCAPCFDSRVHLASLCAPAPCARALVRAPSCEAPCLAGARSL